MHAVPWHMLLACMCLACPSVGYAHPYTLRWQSSLVTEEQQEPSGFDGHLDKEGEALQPYILYLDSMGGAKSAVYTKLRGYAAYTLATTCILLLACSGGPQCQIHALSLQFSPQMLYPLAATCELSGKTRARSLQDTKAILITSLPI